ncbi:Rpn family recombination-promoting nuclease/putative transposase [Agathobacter sp.]
MTYNSHKIKTSETRSIKKYEDLTISDDFMFSIIMRQPEYCKPFLETVLGIKIDHIEYPKFQEVIDLDIKAKSIRLDVYVDDGENTVYNIEMQNVSKPDQPKRMRYYQDLIDLDLIEKGQDYNELKNNIVIFVCTFDPFKLGRHYYSFENICIEDHELKLNDGTKKIILNTKGIIDDISPDLKTLLDFIDGNKPEDAFTRKLSVAVEDARLSKKWRVQYMNLQLAYLDKLNEGKELGKEIGIEEAKTENAKRMLSANKFSLEDISYFSGLSIDDVKKLQQEIAK